MNAEQRACEQLAVVRAADARAAVLHENLTICATLQELEQLTHAEIPAAEWENRRAIPRKAVRTHLRLGFTTWEVRFRGGLQQVYWQQVEARGRWANATTQWRINKSVARAHSLHRNLCGCMACYRHRQE